MMWILVHPKATHATLGFVPDFLSTDDERPAREQIKENYVRGLESDGRLQAC